MGNQKEWKELTRKAINEKDPQEASIEKLNKALAQREDQLRRALKGTEKKKGRESASLR